MQSYGKLKSQNHQKQWKNNFSCENRTKLSPEILRILFIVYCHAYMLVWSLCVKNYYNILNYCLLISLFVRDPGKFGFQEGRDLSEKLRFYLSDPGRSVGKLDQKRQKISVFSVTNDLKWPTKYFLAITLILNRSDITI